MNQQRIVPLLLALFILLFGAMPLSAAGAPLALVGYTIDGGGHQPNRSADGRFSLSGTIGQADSTNTQGTGQRTLLGGFWGSYTPMNNPGNAPSDGAIEVFLPLVSR